jgi:hypothetical protein
LPGENYFSGGYNVANHTSYLSSNIANGLQLECNYTNVRDTYSNRKAFADTLAKVVLSYLNFHQNIEFSNCNLSYINNVDLDKDISIVCNVVKLHEGIIINKTPTSPCSYLIYDALGNEIISGQANETNSITLGKLSSAGLYYLKLSGKDYFKTIKFIVVD